MTKFTKLDEKRSRAVDANELIAAIASYGRRFFFYPQRYGVGYIRVDDRGRIWFIDGWTGEHIYLHYAYWGRGFSEGGTLRQLVISLKEYIATGRHVHRARLGPFPSWLNGGDPWGYGEDMQIVRDCAVENGLMLPHAARNTEPTP